MRDYSYSLDNTYASAITKNTAAITEQEDPTGIYNNYADALTYDMDAIAAKNDGFNVNSDNTGILFDGNDNNGVYATIDWARIVAEGTNKALELGKQTNKDYNVTYSSVATTGEKYVFSTALKWLGSDIMNSVLNDIERHDDRWLFKIGLLSTASGGPGDKNVLPIYGWAKGRDTIELRLGVGKDAPVIAAFEAGVWHGLSIEYTPIASDGVYSGSVKVYVDNTCVYDGIYSGNSAIDNSDYIGAFIELRGIARDCRVRLDNTYASAITPRGSGAEAASGKAQSFTDTDRITNISNPVANITTHEISAIDGDNAFSVIRNSGTSTGGGDVYFQNTDLINNAAALGGSYVFESDIRLPDTATWNADKGTDNWTAKLAMNNTSSMPFFQLLTFPTYGEDGKITEWKLTYNGGGSANIITTFAADEWVNIRVEYTPVTDTTGDIVIFVNGRLTSWITDLATLSSASNATYMNVKCETRCYTSNSSITFDNMYVGVCGLEESGSFELNFDGNDTMSYTVSDSGMKDKITTDNGYLNYHTKLGDGLGTSSYTISFVSDTEVLGQTQVGSVFVFEYDLYLNVFNNGTTATDGSHSSKATSWWSYAAAGVLSNGKYAESSASFVNNGTSNDVAKLGSTAIETGEWYTIRVEYVVTALDTDAKSITLSAQGYVKGKNVGAGNGGKVIAQSSKLTIDDTNVVLAAIQHRCANTGNTFGHLEELDVYYDNIRFTAYNTVPVENAQE